MKGHDRIIETRKAGHAPAIGVMFDLTDEKPWFDWLETKHPGMPVVWIERHDKPRLLDLRFVIGLHVVIAAESDRDWTELADACIQAKAANVTVTQRLDGDTHLLWSSHAHHQ